MKRVMILLALCLGCIACKSEWGAAQTEGFHPIAYREKVDAEQMLKNRFVRFVFDDAVESVSLWDLGARSVSDGTSWDEDTLRACLASLTRTYRTMSKDAAAELTGIFSEPYRFIEETAGKEPDTERWETALASFDFHLAVQSFSVPYHSILPENTLEQVKREHALLATYSTSFAKGTLSKSNRVHNIEVAAERINGVVVQPDTVFSMNRTIGDRTKKNGYLLAGAITNGKNVTEYGGGVCQVSTTLFNSVLMADLEIVERYHHSWPMAYAPLGRDATIATGQKDFRFRNTTDVPITIFATVDRKAKTISVSLYGKHSDAFDHIEIVSEQIKRLPSKPAEHHLDESLPPNTKEIDREGRRGRVSVTYLDYYDADGERIKRVTAFEDTYPSIGEIAYLSSDLYYGKGNE